MFVSLTRCWHAKTQRVTSHIDCGCIRKQKACHACRENILGSKSIKARATWCVETLFWVQSVEICKFYLCMLIYGNVRVCERHMCLFVGRLCALCVYICLLLVVVLGTISRNMKAYMLMCMHARARACVYMSLCPCMCFYVYMCAFTCTCAITFAKFVLCVW